MNTMCYYMQHNAHTYIRSIFKKQTCILEKQDLSASNDEFIVFILKPLLKLAAPIDAGKELYLLFWLIPNSP